MRAAVVDPVGIKVSAEESFHNTTKDRCKRDWTKV